MFALLLLSAVSGIFLYAYIKAKQPDDKNTVTPPTAEQMIYMRDNLYPHYCKALTECAYSLRSSLEIEPSRGIAGQMVRDNRVFFDEKVGVVFHFRVQRALISPLLSGEQQYSTKSREEIKLGLNETIGNYCLTNGLAPALVWKAVDSANHYIDLYLIGDPQV